MRSTRLISHGKSSLVNTPAWQQLLKHHKDMKNTHMMNLFAQAPNRFDQFTLKFEDILLDYSGL